MKGAKNSRSKGIKQDFFVVYVPLRDEKDGFVDSIIPIVFSFVFPEAFLFRVSYTYLALPLHRLSINGALSSRVCLYAGSCVRP